MKHKVNQASTGVTTSSDGLKIKQTYIQKYANRENIVVTANTPKSAIFFGLSTEGMQTALMNSRLNAADPTIVDAPNAPAGSSNADTVSRTFNKISGAEDPKAMRERLASVAFHTGCST